MTNAVLLRDIPLVVRDVSSGGCLFESSAPLHVGTVGWLEVEFEGERRFEWFRVARVHVLGERAFMAGVEFLPLAAAGADSFRSAIGRLRRPTPANDSFTGEVERSPGERGSTADDSDNARTESSSEIVGASRKIVSFFRRRS
jgi:hypothetical protein